ncbi:outer membrane protein assembly factor BamB [Sphaerisporangium rubeum]|uniref:Outer membrane protein assembly factor BamB n=1 Tax=Sphaerisporangium rubeum TaxID=321317 RepID=A0A7X0ILT1_9ACTN|nr:outer membrane protein assembly factor BamB [Sphaerisporangium rubeum]
MFRPLATPVVALAAVLVLAGCSGGSGGGAAAQAPRPAWHTTEVNAVSRAAVATGVAAVTSMKPDGTLETAALDLSSGRALWRRPASLAGRLPGMGVPPPAAVSAAGGKGVVAAAAPSGKSGKEALLVAADARTGHELWSRPVRTTFGPQACGPYLCVSEHTALATARMVVLDPLTGAELWRLPGIAEAEWSDTGKVVVLRLAKHPALSTHDLRTGKTVWELPVEQALAPGVDLSGGWSFGSAGGDLIGYVAPYTSPRTGRASVFGVFSVRLADGKVNWLRPSVVRVYPSGSPGFAPVVRPVDEKGRFGGFARLDPGSGRVVGQITADQVPGTGWWLAFPGDMARLGFLKPSHAGASFELASGRPVPVTGQRGWSFCVTDPKPLALTRTPQGFFPVASLCEFDLATGVRAPTGAVPPQWFTGSQDGWRLWRDEKGGLHAVRDATGTTPGMYG